MSEAFREYVLRVSAALHRTERLHGREHLVVPVVALVEGVLHAVNADEAEYVPPEFIAAAAASFNGRPLVLGHPVQGGRHVSAVDPRVMEERGFGTIFNARDEKGKLVMEAWCDVERLVALGQQRMLDDLRNGKQIEVSVGAAVKTLAERAVWNGKKYAGRWAAGAGDHLAFLPGGRGACSVAMGCGAMRAAEAYEIDGGEMRTADGQPGHPFYGNQWTDGSAAAAAHDKAAKEHQSLQVTHRKLDRPQMGHDYDGSKAARFQRRSQAAAEASQKALDKSSEIESKSVALHGDHEEAARNATEYAINAESAASHGDHGEAARAHGRAANAHMAAAKLLRGDTRSLEMPKKKSLRERLKAMTAALGKEPEADATPDMATALKVAGAFTDSPSEAAAEEAAELVAYNAMRVVHDAVMAQCDAIDGVIDDLIADEEEDPTETAADEQAETEVERSRLDSIQTMAMSMVSGLQSLISVTYKLQQPSLVAPSDPRYAEAIKALAGARHSKSDQKMLQTVHDHSVSLGAACEPMKAATQHGDCACQHKESDMNPEQKKAAITALASNEFSAIRDLKVLEALGDDALKALQASADASKTAKATTDAAIASKDAEIRAAQAAPKQMTEAEALAAFPAFKALADEKATRDQARKDTLVGKLKVAAAHAKTEEQLKAMDLAALEEYAALLKVDQEPAPALNFAGRGVPRVAASGERARIESPDAYGLNKKAAQ